MPWNTFSKDSTGKIKVASSGNIMDELIGYGAAATGGKDGTVVTVTNTNDTGAGSLRQAIIDASGATWIVFSEGLTGTISMGSDIAMKADITIDGRGADITLDGYALYFSNGDENCILMYLTLQNGANDLISLDQDPNEGTIWIHHCTLDQATDECIGQTNGVTDVTVSWCILRNDSGADEKGWLIGGSNGDTNPMWVTSHHNWFDCGERQPRTRYVRLHQYNCLQEDWNFIGMAIGQNGQCYLENAVGDNLNGDTTMADYASAGDSPPGKIASIGTHYLLNGAAITERDAGNVFDPSTDGPYGQSVGYSWTADTADASLKTAIESGAGWQDVDHPGTTAPWDV